VTLDEAQAEASQISNSLQGLSLKKDLRSRTALACFAIAQQHHAAILILLANSPPLHSTAFALLRPLMEATLRGEWILHCASDEQVKFFINGEKKQIDMSSLVKALEKTLDNSTAHDVLYKGTWALLSTYTHTYENQVQHWLVSNDISSKYLPEQVQWLISNASVLLKLCSASIRSLAVESET
jgi:hypothetical protein